MPAIPARAPRRLPDAIICMCLVFLATATDAYAARAKLHAVDVGSEESADITSAQLTWIMQDPILSGRNVTLQPVFIRRNDRYAYLIAQLSGYPKFAFLDAILELRKGRWVSLGYEGSATKPSGSIREMCRYGAGLSGTVFRECK